MPNLIFRERLINKIRYAMQEATNAVRADHPGLTGMIRELAASDLLQPILPIGFEIGTGKIVDRNGGSSSQVDLVIYSRNALPPVMYSDRDGVYPIESTYFAFEIKSQSNASNIQDAMHKARHIAALDYPGKAEHPRKTAPVVPVYFAFGSDLTGSENEFQRYKKYDTGWKADPAIRVICIPGQGYWFYQKDRWLWQPSTSDFDEVLILLSHVVNTLVSSPLFAQRPVPLFGDYLRPPTDSTEASE